MFAWGARDDEQTMRSSASTFRPAHQRHSMTDSHETLRRRLHQPVAEPYQEAAAFLRAFWCDEGDPVAVRARLSRLGSFNTNRLVRGVEALEQVLATTPGEVSLLDLVAWQANRQLSDASDAGARRWLEEAASMVREVLAEMPSATPEHEG